MSVSSKIHFAEETLAAQHRLNIELSGVINRLISGWSPSRGGGFALQAQRKYFMRRSGHIARNGMSANASSGVQRD